MKKQKTYIVKERRWLLVESISEVDASNLEEAKRKFLNGECRSGEDYYQMDTSKKPHGPRFSVSKEDVDNVLA